MIATAATALVFAPNVIWNFLHSFETVAHTASNANWSAERLFNFAKAGEFIAAQVGIIGPIAAAMLIWGAVKGWRDPQIQQRRHAPPVAFASDPRDHRRSGVHLARQCELGGACVRRARYPYLGMGRARTSHRLARANLALNAALAVALGVLAVSPAFVAAIGQENSVKRLRGWDEAGRSIVTVASSAPFAAILSDDREDMASLYYYTRARTQPLRMWPKQNRRQRVRSDASLCAPKRPRTCSSSRAEAMRATSSARSRRRSASRRSKRDSIRSERAFFSSTRSKDRSTQLFSRNFLIVRLRINRDSTQIIVRVDRASRALFTRRSQMMNAKRS